MLYEQLDTRIFHSCFTKHLKVTQGRFWPPWCHGFLGVYQLRTPSPTVHDTITNPRVTSWQTRIRNANPKLKQKGSWDSPRRDSGDVAATEPVPVSVVSVAALVSGGHHLESSNADGWSDTFLGEQVVTIFLVARSPAEAEIKESSRLI